MADKLIAFPAAPGTAGPILVKAQDNGDGTWALATNATITNATITTATMKIDQATAHANEVVIKSALAGVPDGGLGVTVSGRLFTHQADGSTAFDITTAPGVGLKATALDLLISVAAACRVTIQMETSGNVLAGFYLAANSALQVTLRGYLKGDATAKKLQAKTSVASAIDVTCVYFFEA